MSTPTKAQAKAQAKAKAEREQKFAEWNTLIDSVAQTYWDEFHDSLDIESEWTTAKYKELEASGVKLMVFDDFEDLVQDAVYRIETGKNPGHDAQPLTQAEIDAIPVAGSDIGLTILGSEANDDTDLDFPPPAEIGDASDANIAAFIAAQKARLEQLGKLTPVQEIYELGEPFEIHDAIREKQPKRLDREELRSMSEEEVAEFKKNPPREDVIKWTIVFADGRRAHVMQSHNRMREEVLTLFEQARRGGFKVAVGPYLFDQGRKNEFGNRAWNLEPQAGFDIRRIG